MVLATLPMSPRTGASNLALAVSALLVPATCLLGPAWAMNQNAASSRRTIALARLSPVLALLVFFAVLTLAP
jgi:hypothetical protein